MEKQNTTTVKFSASEKSFIKTPDLSPEEQARIKSIIYAETRVMILLAMMMKGKKVEANKEKTETEEEEEETEVAVKLTKKEEEAITARVKKELKALSALPPAPYQIITPAPALGHLNAAQLCNMLAPLFIAITAISAFSTASPTVAACQQLYLALFPLSSIGRKISGSDKLKRNTLTKQLRDTFYSCLKSCALIANGDLALYLLIGSPVKSKGTKSGKKLPVCEFTLNQKEGRGIVGVACKKVKGAKGYTVWWGKGDFDASTWNNQSGGTKQLISTFFEPGEYISFVMIAFKADGEEGSRANVQACNVPFA